MTGEVKIHCDMKKRIAIVAGGDSSEYEVSLRSADGIKSFLDSDKFDSDIVLVHGGEWVAIMPDGSRLPIDRNDFSYTAADGGKVRFDFAYITIHGTPGENGMIQGYFELIGLEYSCCGVLASALTFNKFMCNSYLRGFGAHVADAVWLRKGDDADVQAITDKVGLPCFVKSNVSGSSFGVSKVTKAEDMAEAVKKAFAEGDEVIVETFLKGTEVTCGMYKTKNKTVHLPITEVVSKREFFDYDAKYKGQVEEITPARIDDAVAADIHRQTEKYYDLLGCKGIVRIDYIITEDGVPYMLEANTTPGMTATSFIPQQVRAAGMEMKDVLSDIIEDRICGC